MDYSNNNIFSKPIQNNKSTIKNMPKTQEEQMLDFAVKACSQRIAESADNYVPEYNKFSPHEISFVIPGTQNVAEISIRQDEEDYKTLRRVYIGVRHKNSDMLISSSVFKGTKKEVLEYLKTLSDERLEETVETIKDLSNESDNEHNSL